MKRRGVTHTSISVFPTQAKSLLSLGREFGSLSRGIQVAVEILYYRVCNGLPTVAEGISTEEEKASGLKVPMTLHLLSRTRFLIDYLSGAELYGSRGAVLSACENVLGSYLVPAYHSLRKKRTGRFS